MIINLLKEKDTCKKIGFTVFVLFVCTTLGMIPVFGINSAYLSGLFGSSTALNFIDMISGGSMSRMTMSAFGISSYISASIIMQLISIVFPSVEKMRQDGEHGRKKIERIEFGLALALTLLGGLGVSFAFRSWGIFVEFNAFYVSIAVLSWLAGTFLIVFLAQKVEDHGFGNGVSLVLAFNILGRLPANIADFYEEKAAGAELASAFLWIAGLIVVLFLFYLIATYLQCGVLNVKIKQNRKVGTAVNTDARIPMSVNIANVLPVVFAASLLSIPNLVVSLLNLSPGETGEKILEALTSSYWYSPSAWYHVAGLLLYVLLIVFFAYFSSEMNFSVEEVAENMRKNGNVIPGVAPGQSTIDYLTKRRSVMTTVNILFLLAISLIPDFLCARLNITSFSFLGTSLIIVVSVLFDTGSRLRAAALPNDKRYRLFGKEAK